MDDIFNSIPADWRYTTLDNIHTLIYNKLRRKVEVSPDDSQYFSKLNVHEIDTNTFEITISYETDWTHPNSAESRKIKLHITFMIDVLNTALEFKLEDNSEIHNVNHPNSLLYLKHKRYFKFPIADYTIDLLLNLYLDLIRYNIRNSEYPDEASN